MREIESKYDGLFIKGGRIHFAVIPDLRLADKDLEFLHITSSAIAVGHLKKVSFYNASFLSTKFSDVVFENCNLGSADICSLWAKNCRFQNVDFSNDTISDSTFIGCTFDRSIFECISLARCQFIDCIFEQFPMDDSTFYLNSFTRCHIKNTHFTESFYYQIFDDCTFDCVNMPPELLGFNFGFSTAVFAQLANGVDLEKVGADFTDNGLYINAAILRINQVHDYYDEALIACVAALSQMIGCDILVKADEIEFLKNLTVYFQEHKLIAPISSLRIWQLLTTCSVAKHSNTAIQKAIPHVREYANMLYFSFLDFQRELQERLVQLPQSSHITDTAELKIIYTEEPSIPLLECLTKLSDLAPLGCPSPRLIRVEKGSFREFHEIAVVVIPYLQTLFAFLGVVVPVVIAQKGNNGSKETKEELSETKADKIVSDSITKENRGIEITLSTTTEYQPPILLPSVTTISPATSQLVYDVAKVLGSQPIVKHTAFCGYNTQNIQSITIRFY